MSSRDQLLGVLATVEGLSASAYRPVVVAPGQVWIEAAGVTRAAGRIFDRAWTVVVCVATDPRAAEQWWDAHILDLVDALCTTVIVADAQPASLAIDTGTVYTVRINVTE